MFDSKELSRLDYSRLSERDTQQLKLLLTARSEYVTGKEENLLNIL